MTQCIELTVKRLQCKKHSIKNSKYCFKHKTILDNNKECVLLVDDVWFYLTKEFTILEIRPLMLSCIKLFKLFSNDNWFKNHSMYYILEYNIRCNYSYLYPKYYSSLIKDYTWNQENIISVRYKNDNCIKINTLISYKSHIYNKFPIHTIDSYLTARLLYKYILIPKVIITLEANNSNLYNGVIKYIINKQLDIYSKYTNEPYFIFNSSYDINYIINTIKEELCNRGLLIKKHKIMKDKHVFILK